MTDLLHRLASRATGRRGRPAAVAVLPPRPAAGRAFGEREPVGPGADTTPQEAADGAARPPDDAATARGAGTGRGAADDRPVHGPADAPHGLPPVAVPALPARGATPSPVPAADAAERGTPGPVRRVEPQDTAPHRPLAAPVSATPATTAAPSSGAPAVRAPADDGGASPVPHGRPGPDGPRPHRRPAAPGQESARPARTRKALGIPVARPAPLPAPVPATVRPRTAAAPTLPAPGEPAPAVTITIGRVEIRAVPPAVRAPAPSEPDGVLRSGTAAGAGTLSLGDFLRGTRDPR
ncbi:hypothetical protein B6R96_30800 [Streptomyces sp. Sge12]|uniref:hypothetical protein n=1 Tax=Streptomyces sp. Sge12 TaxID=1972846 RepID=UPI0009C272A0|nr:hypothetical protein [Streptomyces sp. Sge12]ARE77791.1 hypothetical protein B6R96_30800 [Streptomyces sp. Sge12]